jgi:hypothetical protein
MPRYIHTLRCLLLILALSLFTTSAAHPWGSKGHEIVAAIAENHLTDSARKRIKELLPQGTTLAEASTWPDKAGRQISDMDLRITSSTSKKTRTPITRSATANCAIVLSKRLPGIPRC